MIPRNRIRPLFALTVVTALLAAFASLAGILRPRLYLPFTPETLLPGAMSQDIVSFLAALGLLVCLWSIRRGAQRAWLVWASLNGYLFYAYALYSFEQVYNPLYLVYIALTGLTLYSILFFFVWMDTDILMRLDASRLPRRAIAAYLLLLVAMFVTVWLSLILPGIASQTPPEGASIFVMDLAFFLPLLVIIAVLLFRDRPLGALLTPIVLIKVGALGCSVLLGELLQPMFGHPLVWPSVGIYALMGLGSAALGLLALARVTLPGVSTDAPAIADR